ncbi:MAG: recombination-associated protein RdgC [Gammaproteobacteria bacterium]
MWFNNILVYSYQSKQMFSQIEAMEQEHLKPCPPHARFTFGWIPPFEQGLIHEVAGCIMICLGKEERILPRSVIQRHLNEKVKILETERGFPVKRSERAQLAEDIEFELLPKAFCLQKKLYAFFDTVEQRLIINTSSVNQAAQMLALLRKSIPDLQIEPMTSPDNLALRFNDWINHPGDLPANFALASDCVLTSLDNEKKRFSCKGGELNEIQSLLSQGFSAIELSLIWDERLQFTLTQTLSLKRIKCLDYLQDEIHQIADMDGEDLQRDARITLLAGELRSLCKDILAELVFKSPQPKNEAPAALAEA